MALISGLMARLIWPKTSIGRVVPPGPVVKKVITKSSKERVKANNAPPKMPGIIKGNVILLKVIHSSAPRSCAASSSVLLKFFKLVLTTMVT